MSIWALMSVSTALVLSAKGVDRRKRAPTATVDRIRADTTCLPGFENGLTDKPPSDFELNLGRCVDSLRSDFPEFMDRELDWSIYARNLEVVDPSGVRVTGVPAYKQVMSAIRMIRKVAFDDASVTFRLRYDWVGKRLIVQWYSHWLWKGSHTPLHVDAVSYFDLNEDGLVDRHHIDRVIVNGKDATPPYGMRSIFARMAVRGMPVPACC